MDSTGADGPAGARRRRTSGLIAVKEQAATSCGVDEEIPKLADGNGMRAIAAAEKKALVGERDGEVAWGG